MLTKEEKYNQLKMPYEEKLQRSKELILEWYLQYRGNVYVSFSGGKDSTALLHLARSIKGCEGIPGVFIDTGLEYPEIRDFVRQQENIAWVKPKKTFKEVIEHYGWPVVSKETARYIYEIRNSNSEKTRQLRLNFGHFFALKKKWEPLINAPFKISDFCCREMKKNPVKEYEKLTGAKPMIGVMASESRQRLSTYLITNCNAFSAKHPISRPIIFWSEQDTLRYLYENNIPIASVYGDIVCEDGVYKTTGVERTGCMFCMFGAHNKCDRRFELMQQTHPKQYDYIMNTLGGKEVLEFVKNCKETRGRHKKTL